MTKSEIIKSLKSCQYNIDRKHCNKCPLYCFRPIVCKEILFRDTIDLINKQEAKLKERGNRYD